MGRSVYVFNIMVIKCTVNIACYMLHFVLINEAVCIKPLQYHMYGLFLLSPNHARPLRRKALLYLQGKLRDNWGVRDDYNKKLRLFLVERKLILKRGGKFNIFLISSLISLEVFLNV
jgi:hypothetical protein